MQVLVLKIVCLDSKDRGLESMWTRWDGEEKNY